MCSRVARADVRNGWPLAAWLLIAAPLFGSCGGSFLEGTGTSPSETACTIQGELTSGELLVPDGSFAFARVSGGRTTAIITDERVTAHLEVDGVVLDGALDRTSGLRAARPLSLGEDILLPTGTEVALLSGRRDHVRIGLGRFAFTLDEGVSWRGVPAAEVACDALGLSFAYRDDASEARDWAELRLPAATATVWLAPGTSVEIAPRPDASPALTLSAREYAHALRVIETRGDFVRVVMQHWTGTVLVGWARSASFVTTEPAGASAMGGLLADILDGGASTYDDCVAATAVDVSVRQIATTAADGTTVPITPSALVQVGSIAAGTHFVRRRTGADALSIAPLPTSGLSITSEAEWLIPLVPVECTEARRPSLSEVLESASKR